MEDFAPQCSIALLKCPVSVRARVALGRNHEAAHCTLRPHLAHVGNHDTRPVRASLRRESRPPRIFSTRSGICSMIAALGTPHSLLVPIGSSLRQAEPNRTPRRLEVRTRAVRRTSNRAEGLPFSVESFS